MNNYVRLFLCWLACGSAVTAWAAPAQQPNSVQQQERQKGRLWTVAVQQGWPALARQPQWPTKDSLDAWLNAQESQAKEIRSFRQQVISYVRDSLKQPSAQRTASAQPTELQQALERQLPLFLSKNRRPLTAAQRQALHQALQAALPDSTHASEPAMISTTLSAADPAVNKQATIPNAPTTNTPAYIVGLAGLAVGFVAGLLTGKFRKNNTSLAPPIPIAATELKAETEKQRRDRESLSYVQKAGNRLQRQTPAIRSTATPPVSPVTTLAPVPVASATVPAEEKEAGLPLGAEVSLTVSSSKKDVPLIIVQLFGPSPDVPVIEARKFSAHSLPQMPICLKLIAAEAATGSFELNPYAEQSRLIGNGIRELRTFFDFDLPLPESFTILTTSRPGTLELRDGSWHLVDKAKIELT